MLHYTKIVIQSFNSHIKHIVGGKTEKSSWGECCWAENTWQGDGLNHITMKMADQWAYLFGFFPWQEFKSILPARSQSLTLFNFKQCWNVGLLNWSEPIGGHCRGIDIYIYHVLCFKLALCFCVFVMFKQHGNNTSLNHYSCSNI